MKILIACEESQTVCKAFRAAGHKAWSCDLEPCSGGHPEWHLQVDVEEILDEQWDLIIAHPPCTHLSVSGARYFAEKRADGRQQAAVKFFMLFVHHPCSKICIENPVGIMSSMWRKPDQIIQPWMFGEDASKATCLWLKGLPPLQTTKVIEGTLMCCGKPIDDKYGCPNCLGDGRARRIYANQTASGQNKLGPSPERARLRSKTYEGIARAMAEQWGKL